MFIVVAFFSPGNTVTIILDNYPPSTLQGVGLRGCKKLRIIVGENSCHFGVSYKIARNSICMYSSLDDNLCQMVAVSKDNTGLALVVLRGSFGPLGPKVAKRLQRLPKGTSNDNGHKATQNLMHLGQRLLSY